MQLFRSDFGVQKGCHAGPWNSELEVSIGYATTGIDSPHFHQKMKEVYLVARGESTILIDGESIELRPGDVVVVEPGEVHTFIASSDDYFHFVLHMPALVGDEAVADAIIVGAARTE
jgi:quercetin dioxygenase-like cupin family protein